MGKIKAETLAARLDIGMNTFCAREYAHARPRRWPASRLATCLIGLICMTDQVLAQSDVLPGALPVAHVSRSAVFFSGHSLLASPIPEFVEAIARGRGISLGWNQQSIGGSTIRMRTRGQGQALAWSGYREGSNRHGQGLDVLTELRTGTTVGGPYDILLITEMHALLEVLLRDDTVRYLRHFHEHFVAANAQGVTWFYEPWLNVNDKTDPRRWISYERDASVAWQCVTARINASLALEARTDRLLSLPAGAALAHLVEKATQTPGVPGITLGSVGKTVDRLIVDDVHITRLGSYYMALVIDAFLFGGLSADAWRPDDVDAVQARSLQGIARDFAIGSSRRAPKSLDECHAYILDGFAWRYWDYVRDARLMKWVNPAHAYLKWAGSLAVSQFQLRFLQSGNPLRLNPEADRSYWFSAP